MKSDSVCNKAAHFLLIPELAFSPPNDAIVQALLECGYQVDLYSPSPLPDISAYGSGVACYPVEYGKRWLLQNVFSSKWRQYRVFSGTAEAPFATVGVLSFWYRRPSFLLVDEIKSGSYYGDDPEYMKRLYRWAMRRASFCVVNDESRIGLLQEYAGIIDASRIMVYPGCFRKPPEPADRLALRRQWGIPERALVLGVSGGFNETAGAEWLLQGFCRNPELYLVVQAVNLPPFNRLLLTYLQGAERLYLESNRLSWRDAWATASVMDIGLAIYLNQAPQFQHMGISSNRLCMFLAMGVPVIASRQPSFRFIEEYDCGVLVDNEREFVAAIDQIAARLPTMRENARHCTREYIRAPERFVELRQRIALLNR
ncbi:MAG TPA: hypothetical protein P5032_02930 [Candidatus Competibacter sp.]|mgnify:CR=1 FL=1|nr:hypothetical protein [Candidatus Competibacter sp.]